MARALGEGGAASDEGAARTASPLSEPLVASLHLGYVVDGFVNLSRSAMQLASHQVLLQLEAAWLPVREGKVHFQETLFALARCEVGQRLPQCNLRDKLDKQMRRCAARATWLQRVCEHDLARRGRDAVRAHLQSTAQVAIQLGPRENR